MKFCIYYVHSIRKIKYYSLCQLEFLLLPYFLAYYKITFIKWHTNMFEIIIMC